MFDFKKLVQQLKANSEIKEVDCSQQQLDAEQSGIIFESVKPNSYVQILSFLGNTIDEKAAQTLGEVIASNKENLEEIYIGDNQLGDKGIKPIANALGANSTLKVLDINTNGITDIGADDIAEALSKNTTLEELEIRNNDISKNGLQKITAAFKSNKDSAVTRLGIAGNPSDGFTNPKLKTMEDTCNANEMRKGLELSFTMK